METIADFIAGIVVRGTSPEALLPKVLDFRSGYQQLYYCFENGLPA